MGLKSHQGFPGGSAVKNLPANARDMASIPGSGISPEGICNPLQYFSLGNPIGRGAWWATVHGVTKSQTQLSNLTTTKSHQHLVFSMNLSIYLFTFQKINYNHPNLWFLELN